MIRRALDSRAFAQTIDALVTLLNLRRIARKAHP